MTLEWRLQAMLRQLGRSGLMLVLIVAASVAAARPAGQASDPYAFLIIILLGTKGGPGITQDRSEPASLLVVDGETYLIDAGAGVTRQIARSGYSIYAISRIFITHHHLDHTAGFEPLLGSIETRRAFDTAYSGKSAPPLQIYGPPATAFLLSATERYLEVSERIFRADMPALPSDSGMFIAHDISRAGQVYKAWQGMPTCS